MEILKQIQSDPESNTLFISLLQAITKEITSKSFSFRFCYHLLAAMDLKALDIHNDGTVVSVVQYIHFVLETFSTLIVETLKVDVINVKDVNLMDRRECCQNGRDLLNTEIKQFVLRIQHRVNSKEGNPKIDELCTSVLTLIELLN